MNSQINTNLNLSIFVFIIFASSRSSLLVLWSPILDRAFIISENRSLTAVIVFTLLDHLVGFNFLRVSSDSLVKLDNRSQRLML